MSLLKRLEAEKPDIRASVAEKEELVDRHLELVHRVHSDVIKEMDSALLTSARDGASREWIVREVRRIAEGLLDQEAVVVLKGERDRVIDDVLDEVMAFGPITGLIADQTVSEIMVNGPRQVYVERKGKIEPVAVRFRDDEHVMHVIEKILAPLGRRIDESSPMVDARLPDGSRVNAIIPPLALNGPVLTIRKFAVDLLEVEDMIRLGTLTPAMAKFLEGCVKARLNVVVSGGTGAGKTTLLNVLSSFIPHDERIVTIEDAAELKLNQEHVVSLETRPPNIEGKGAVRIRDLVRNALRMRPDRIVVGEVRGGEALDMLQAMNTGHDGSLTTAHANSPRDVLSRLETMVLMAGVDLPLRAIREQISSALDLIVHEARLRDGTRRVVNVTEVLGMEGDVIILQDIFVFEQRGIDARGRVIGQHRATGIRPKCLETLATSGIVLPPELFEA